jgi:hypothetical protein
MELVFVGRLHGGVSPGHYYEPFRVLNGQFKKIECEGNAKMAVIKAIFADRTEWIAKGTDWQER